MSPTPMVSTIPAHLVPWNGYVSDYCDDSVPNTATILRRRPPGNQNQHRAERDGASERAPRDFDSLRAVVGKRLGDLPKRLSQVGKYALDHPDEIAFGTTATHCRRRARATLDARPLRAPVRLRGIFRSADRLPRAAARSSLGLCRAATGAARRRTRHAAGTRDPRRLSRRRVALDRQACRDASTRNASAARSRFLPRPRPFT